MIFVVYNPQKKGVMQTEQWGCVPNQEILKDMAENGFTFKIDGKRISPKEIEKLRGFRYGEL